MDSTFIIESIQMASTFPLESIWEVLQNFQWKLWQFCRSFSLHAREKWFFT